MFLKFLSETYYNLLIIYFFNPRYGLITVSNKELVIMTITDVFLLQYLWLSGAKEPTIGFDVLNHKGVEKGKSPKLCP